MTKKNRVYEDENYVIEIRTNDDGRKDIIVSYFKGNHFVDEIIINESNFE